MAMRPFLPLTWHHLCEDVRGNGADGGRRVSQTQQQAQHQWGPPLDIVTLPEEERTGGESPTFPAGRSYSTYTPVQQWGKTLRRKQTEKGRSFLLTCSRPASRARDWRRTNSDESLRHAAMLGIWLEEETTKEGHKCA